MLKPVRWTPDLVSNFWDALTQTKLLDIGFSKLAGQVLVRSGQMAFDARRAASRFWSRRRGFCRAAGDGRLPYRRFRELGEAAASAIGPISGQSGVSRRDRPRCARIVRCRIHDRGDRTHSRRSDCVDPRIDPPLSQSFGEVSSLPLPTARTSITRCAYVRPTGACSTAGSTSGRFPQSP